jgi:hypothetical protein
VLALSLAANRALFPSIQLLAITEMTIDSESSFMLVPLSFADRISNLNTMTTHAGYTLPRQVGEEWDVGKLEEAFRRAADKWRLLAGRVVKDEVSCETSSSL